MPYGQRHSTVETRASRSAAYWRAAFRLQLSWAGRQLSEPSCKEGKNCMKTEGQELQLFTVLALFMHGVQMLVVGMWAGGWVGST